MDLIDRFRGCLLGLAVGDALGAQVEFMLRGSFEPVTDMVGGGPHKLRPGEWTDDTSMALCLAYSLVSQKGFDARDQMDRYLRWERDGYLNSTGRCFDIGGTVATALQRYERTGDPFAGSTDPMSAGNGSIMRLAPAVLFYYPDHDAVVHNAVESSRTTHAAPEVLDCVRLFAQVIYRALDGASKEDVLAATDPASLSSPLVAAIARGEYRHKSEPDIRSGGYVVETLEAALWCFAQTESFESAIIRSANLGHDSDTTAAVCGQVAGAFYGVQGIPAGWIRKITMLPEIEALARKLHLGASASAA